MHYNPYLENYTFYHVKSKSHFGGVGVFIKNCVPCNLRNDISFAEHGLFEMLWLELPNMEKNQKSIIGLVYRHPGIATIPTFTARIEQTLVKLNQEKASFYIFGDYNINLIKTDQIHNISEFVNTMHSLGALNMVNKPTRFPRGAQLGAPSLLDHIWTNEISYINKINLIIDPISDHRPMLTTINSNKNALINSQNDYFIRDMENFDVNAFNETLFDCHQEILECTTIDQKFSMLQKHIINSIDKHAPNRKRTRKEKKFAAKPWISNSIQISINNKNNLYYHLEKHPNAELSRKYNKMKKNT